MEVDAEAYDDGVDNQRTMETAEAKGFALDKEEKGGDDAAVGDGLEEARMDAEVDEDGVDEDEGRHKERHEAERAVEVSVIENR